MIIANVGLDEAREIMKEDPFSIHGTAENPFIEFTPGKYDDRFSCFVKQVVMSGNKIISYGIPA